MIKLISYPNPPAYYLTVPLFCLQYSILLKTQNICTLLFLLLQSVSGPTDVDLCVSVCSDRSINSCDSQLNTYEFIKCKENRQTWESGVKKTTEKWFILVNSVSFSLLYNTGICSWHSLKGQSTQKQNSHPSSPLWSQHENNCHQFCLKGDILCFHVLFFCSKTPKNSRLRDARYKIKQREKNKLKLNEKAPKATTDRSQPNNWKLHGHATHIDLHWELYRHAKTTLLWTHTHTHTHTHTLTHPLSHTHTHTHTTDQCFCKILIGSWTDDDWCPPQPVRSQQTPGALWVTVTVIRHHRLSDPIGIKLKNRGTRDRREEPIRAKDGQQSRWADYRSSSAITLFQHQRAGLQNSVCICFLRVTRWWVLTSENDH